ncbi:MAG: DUF2293 domain-containing protein [Prolixibacteraceae bacterium]|nr:DUF2293 domain-containing protein [Prolixibacteraceae bacterium]
MEIGKRTVRPGNNGCLIGEKGESLVSPASWTFLPAGDTGLTRKVTSEGLFWRVEVKKGKRTISLGIWAPANTITRAQEEVRSVRLTEDYKKKRISELDRREKKQGQYEEEFCIAIEAFLNFHDDYKETGKKLARAVTTHAIPVGSGTVARTQMIPIEERASLAVIAWMRHQTTAYDSLKIARIKGERRAVRRSFSQQSILLLANYREGKMSVNDCPLYQALSKL